MHTRIRKWGNSLGLRIPKAFAEEAGVEDGSAVDLSWDGERLVVQPVRRSYGLEDLLAGITEENRHDEIDTGDVAGREAW